MIPVSVTVGKKLSRVKPGYAIDRDLTNIAGTETDNGAGWIKVEFDKIYTIHKVVIYWRFYTNWFYPIWECAKSIDKFKGCVDRENNVDVSVYEGEVHKISCGTLQLTYGLEQSDQIYTLLCNAEGDTIKLSKTTGQIVVAEIVIIGEYRYSYRYSYLVSI